MKQAKPTATIPARAEVEAEAEHAATANAPAPNGASPNGAAHVLVYYMPEEDLAEQLDIGMRTMRRWRALRQSPPYLMIGRQVLYRRDAVKEWLRKRERGFEEPHSSRRRGADR